jgi:hypothetical protein
MDNSLNYIIISLRILILIITIIWIIHIYKLIKHIYFWYWVPFVPTPDYKVQELSKIIKLSEWQNFLDIWCWDWKILEIMKKTYSNAKIYWIENSPGIYKLALNRKKKNNLEYNIIKWDFFLEDFSKYNIIYTFMIPYLMTKIWNKIKKECKPWTLFYSSAYEIKWVKEYQKIEIKENNFIYVYKV